MNIDAVADHLDQLLSLSDYRDASVNGLQVRAGDQVTRVAVSVDASLDAIEAAAAEGADLLLCHHGLLWGDARPLTGVLGRRVGALFGHGLSLYAAHLPLDAHPELGNNAELARLLGLRRAAPFGEYRGQRIGLVGTLATPAPAGEVLARATEGIGAPIGVVEAGPDRVSTVAVVSGAAGSIVEQAPGAGVDMVITGEPDHTAAVFARDQGLHLAFFGHWATEVFGVRAVGRHLREALGLPWSEVGTSSGF